jgi:hypothetical protein
MGDKSKGTREKRKPKKKDSKKEIPEPVKK